MNEKLTFTEALKAAHEIQIAALKNPTFWSVDIRTYGIGDSRYVSLSLFPNHDNAMQNEVINLDTKEDIDKAFAYISKFKTTKEQVEVRLLVSYETNNKLSSEEAMYTAADLVINRNPVSVVDGVKVTDVETAEYSLKF